MEVRAVEEEVIIGINSWIHETPILLFIVVIVLFSVAADGNVEESGRRFVVHTLEEIEVALRTYERR